MNYLLQSSPRSERLARRIGFFTAFLFAAAYILCVNSSSTKGYILSDAQQQNATIRLENSRVNAEITRLRSLSSLQIRTRFTQLVPVDRVEYVHSTSDTVAVK